MAKKKKKKKNGSGVSSTTVIIIVAALTFIIGVFLISKYPDTFMRPRRPGPHGPVPGVAATKEVKLYLSDEEGLQLAAVKKNIQAGELSSEIKEAVAALAEDSSGTIPSGTRVLDVRVKDGIAYVDFSPEIITNHEGGSSGESQTVYSIVDTITLNFPAVKYVQILVNGKTVQTIAGHIDVSLPLGPDRDIIKN